MKANAFLTSLVLAAAAIAVWLAARPASPPPLEYDPADALLSASALDWQMSEAVTLDEAVANLSNCTGVRIVLDWPQLSAAGISRERRKISNSQFISLTVRSTLKSLARNYRNIATQSAPAPTLLFSRTPDGAIMVSIDHDDRPQVRIYDVSDLLADDYWGTKIASAQAHDAKATRIGYLVDFLQNHMDPAELQPLPGGIYMPVNRIDIVGSRLIVMTSSAQHARLGRMLTSLRRLD